MDQQVAVALTSTHRSTRNRLFFRARSFTIVSPSEHVCRRSSSELEIVTCQNCLVDFAWPGGNVSLSPS